MPRPLLLVLALAIAGLIWFMRFGSGEDARGGLERAGPAAANGAAPARGELRGGGPSADASRADRGPAGAGTPLRLRLRDEATGETLPDYLVHVVSRTARVERASDADGVVDVGPLPSGEYSIEAIDHLELYVFRQDTLVGHEPGVELHDLALTVGPTFELLLDVPTDARALTVELEDASASGPGADGLRTPLRRDGARLWCRFPIAPMGFDARRELVIRAPDGQWTARAPTTHAVGVCPYPPRFALQFMGRLEFELRAPPGVPLDDVRVTLHPLPLQPVDMTGFEAPEYALDARTVSWPRLPCGDYRARFTSSRFEYLETTVQLREEPLRVPVTLVPRPGGGEVSGVVRSTTGEAVRRAEIVLRSNGAERLNIKSPVHWNQVGGAWQGTFRFASVPAGDWDLVPSSPDWEVWSPTKIIVAPPVTGLSLDVERGTERASLGFDVRDPRTGESLHGFNVSITNGTGSTRTVRGARAGVVAIDDLPTAAPLDWTLELAGYRTSTGDETAFTRRSRMDGRDVLVAPLQLVPE